MLSPHTTVDARMEETAAEVGSPFIVEAEKLAVQHIYTHRSGKSGLAEGSGRAGSWIIACLPKGQLQIEAGLFQSQCSDKHIQLNQRLT